MSVQNDIPTKEFQFVSPGPGAYRVRLVGSDPGNIASVLLSGEADRVSLLLAPGAYTAIIEPVGTSEIMRQAVELHPDQDEAVQLTDSSFSERPLSLSTSTGVFVTSGAAAQLQFKRPSGQFEKATPTREAIASDAFIAPDDRPAHSSPEQRDFSIGLSVRNSRDPKRVWRRGTLPSTVTDEPGGGAVVVLRRPPHWLKEPEWRLTVSVAGDKRWRMRVPLFRGGVQVLLVPAVTSAGLDVAVSMTPRNAGRASLVANLEQMFLSSGSDVIRSSLPGISRKPGNKLLDHLLAENEDPWTILAAALLLIRSQEAAASVDTLRVMARKWPFIPDMAVIRAWAAAAATDGDPVKVEQDCLGNLRAIRGHPYFAATQALGLELLTGLVLGASTTELKKRASRERDRWARVSRRQVTTGALLGWEDSRPAHGHSLDRDTYMTVAQGHVDPNNVELVPLASDPAAPRHVKVPALTRQQRDPEDPWKGRFGGKAQRSGYRLEAEFKRGPGAWVEVTIYVRATQDAPPARHVELFLHSSFRPDHLKLKFVDGVASYSVLAWGGFTVGAWIPHPGVELELDLSKMADAPAAIREY